MAYTEKVKFSDTGRYGCGLNDEDEDEDDVYTIREFIDACKCGAFIDYDGFGYPVKNNLANKDIYIIPSELSKIPGDATHIVWYNR